MDIFFIREIPDTREKLGFRRAAVGTAQRDTASVRQNELVVVQLRNMIKIDPIALVAADELIFGSILQQVGRRCADELMAGQALDLCFAQDALQIQDLAAGDPALSRCGQDGDIRLRGQSFFSAASMRCSSSPFRIK